MAAVAAGFFVAAEAASAQGEMGFAKFESKIKMKGHQAALTVSYQCDIGDHIWVSAKQTASGATDPALKGEGSSALAASWWQSHRNYFICDGHKHTNRFYIDRFEPGSKGRLVNGRAWVQFCVTASGPTPDVEGTLTVVKTGWVKVR